MTNYQLWSSLFYIWFLIGVAHLFVLYGEKIEKRDREREELKKSARLNKAYEEERDELKY